MKKIVYIGTHPQQCNGYSKVVYNHLKCLSRYNDVHIICYGIQYNKRSVNVNRHLDHDNIFVYQTSSDQNGFAFDQLKDFMKLTIPDIVFIYNDPYVVRQYLQVLEAFKCEKYIYLDLVYPNVYAENIKYIESQVDKIFVFHENIKKLYTFEKETIVLQHGHNETLAEYSRFEACNTLKLDPNCVYILNLNRNQPRKRYDIFIASVVKYLCIKNDDIPVKFILGTELAGSFNIIEMYQNACKLNNINTPFDEVFIVVQNPQTLDDSIIELLYIIGDIGINTCDGEGWGLCNFEHMRYESPQILPKLPCFEVYCNEENSLLIEPTVSLYNTNDAIGGMQSIIDSNEVANCINMYVLNSEMRKQHGTNAKIDTEGFTWTRAVEELHSHLAA